MDTQDNHQGSESPTSAPTPKASLKRLVLESLFSALILLIVVPAVWQGDRWLRQEPQLLEKAQRTAAAARRTQKTQVSSVRETILLLQAQYIKELHTLDLLNGAVEGVNYTLDKFGYRQWAMRPFDPAKITDQPDSILIASFEGRLQNILDKLEKEPQEKRLLRRGQLEKAVERRIQELEEKEKAKEGAAKEGNKDEEEPQETALNSESLAQDRALASEGGSDDAEAGEPTLKDSPSPKNSASKKESSEEKTPSAPQSPEAKKDDPQEIVKDFNDKPIILDRQYLIYGALNGIAAATGDPFTAALPPQEVEVLEEQLGASDYGGVGVYIESDLQNNGQLTVVEPVEGSPAQEKGLLPGDKIMAIDGKKTNTIDIQTSSAMIRGKVGSTVVLTIERGNKRFEVALERRNIRVSSVSSKLLPNKLGYLRLRFFGPETTDEFDSHLKKLEAQGIKGLIVDLRNNTGGYVDSAIGVSSEFLPYDSTITSVVNPRLERLEPYASRLKEQCCLPLVLLVNRFSASASEITAGALQDYERALLVGERTFGKGSVQSLVDLSDGGALKLTIAHYLTPHDKDIHMKGIKPDLTLEARPTNKMAGPEDEQFQLAVRQLERLIQLGVSDKVDAQIKKELAAQAPQVAQRESK